MGARTANAVLGLWLIVSAFLWPHSRHQFVSAVVGGIFALTLALFGMAGLAWPRYLNVLIGAGLIVSGLVWPRVSTATAWNHVLVGLGLAIFGLTSALRSQERRGPTPPRS